MSINMIVCMDKNRGIGKGNSLPWHLPKELAYFKEITKGHVVLFGRSTWDSLPKKPLPDRKNAVMTRDLKFNVPQVWRFCEIEDILWVERTHGKQVFVCGGQSLYEQCMPYADRLYITRINTEFDCDTFFHELDRSLYRVIDSPTPIIDNVYELNFTVLE